MSTLGVPLPVPCCEHKIGQCPHWYREPGDPTTGIFGHTWWHEGCKVVEPFDTGDPQPCTEECEKVGSEGDGVNRFDLMVYTITCQDCAAVLTFTEKEWNPDDGPEGD